MGVERRVQPLEFRDLRFVQLRPMYVPSQFLALLIEGCANYRRRTAVAVYPKSGAGVGFEPLVRVAYYESSLFGSSENYVGPPLNAFDWRGKA